MNAITHTTYASHKSPVTKASKETACNVLDKYAKVVRHVYTEADRSLADAELIDLTVSYDGSWTKCSHNSVTCPRPDTVVFALSGMFMCQRNILSAGELTKLRRWTISSVYSNYIGIAYSVSAKLQSRNARQSNPRKPRNLPLEDDGARLKLYTVQTMNKVTADSFSLLDS